MYFSAELRAQSSLLR